MNRLEALDALHYQPKPISDADLALMRRLDELHLEYAFLGSRRLARILGQDQELDGLFPSIAYATAAG